jgi:predicted amidohydrolase
LTSLRTIRVCTLQPALRWLAPMPNLHLIRLTVERALAASPADLLVLPETFNGMPSEYDADAGGQARTFLSTLAKACQVAVVGGSIDLPREDGSRRNSCFVVDAEGREVGAYDKRVLFANEQGTRTAGTGPGVFELAGIRVGVLICADLWEPVYLHELTGQVDLVCVPAKTTVESSSYTEYARRLWWNLAMTRAMETGLPLVVSDWCELRHEATAATGGTRVRSVHYTSGGSSIVDPGKRPMIDEIQVVLPRGQEGLLSAVIDLEATQRYREHRRTVGLLRDRKIDSFGSGVIEGEEA